MNILYLILGWSCILFFGFGFFKLLYKNDYKNSVLSLGFVILGIWIINIEGEEKVTSNNIEISSTTNAQPLDKLTSNNTVTSKTSPLITSEEKHSEQANQLATTIQKIIDVDFSFDTALKEIKLNENVGSDSLDDYIALIYLSYDQPHSEETTKKWIDTYTSHLSASLASNPLNLSQLIIFWETPRFKENWNTAEFKLLKEDNVFYFESKTFDKTIFN